jgi:hypothetical protein
MSEAADVPRLTRLWDERLRRDASRFDLLAPEAIQHGTLLREPASEEDIVIAERRLGVTLPPTYRAFLLCSNGAYASSLGPERQHWGDTYRHGFVPVQELTRFADSEHGRFLIELWTEELADGFMDPTRDTPPTGDEVAQVGYYAPMKDAFLISRPIEAFADLLVPRAGSEEWEVWTFANDGAGAYRSFAAFLRNRINQPDRRPDPELADQYAAEVRGGMRHRLHDLAEIGDPRVGPLAFAYMLDPAVDEFMKRGSAQPVGKVADPTFVRDLRRVYEQATMADFRMELLHALIRCGDPEIERTLQAIADDPDDGAQRWASLLLPRLHLLRPS